MMKVVVGKQKKKMRSLPDNPDAERPVDPCRDHVPGPAVAVKDLVIGAGR